MKSWLEKKLEDPEWAAEYDRQARLAEFEELAERFKGRAFRHDATGWIVIDDELLPVVDLGVYFNGERVEQVTDFTAGYAEDTMKTTDVYAHRAYVPPVPGTFAGRTPPMWRKSKRNHAKRARRANGGRK